MEIPTDILNLLENMLSKYALYQAAFVFFTLIALRNQIKFSCIIIQHENNILPF